MCGDVDGIRQKGIKVINKISNEIWFKLNWKNLNGLNILYYYPSREENVSFKTIGEGA